jgi:hypothetical protein
LGEMEEIKRGKGGRINGKWKKEGKNMTSM